MQMIRTEVLEAMAEKMAAPSDRLEDQEAGVQIMKMAWAMASDPTSDIRPEDRSILLERFKDWDAHIPC